MRSALLTFMIATAIAGASAAEESSASITGVALLTTIFVGALTSIGFALYTLFNRISRLENAPRATVALPKELVDVLMKISSETGGLVAYFQRQEDQRAEAIKAAQAQAQTQAKTQEQLNAQSRARATANTASLKHVAEQNAVREGATPSE